MGEDLNPATLKGNIALVFNDGTRDGRIVAIPDEAIAYSAVQDRCDHF